mmetsp:Transcript_6774/g.19066  ORF Transcript_6774/g.19066 Transcript_6774/m.19066 type:complete len:365 (+) Transcript_6774:2787-3881(+)
MATLGPQAFSYVTLILSLPPASAAMVPAMVPRRAYEPRLANACTAPRPFDARRSRPRFFVSEKLEPWRSSPPSSASSALDASSSSASISFVAASPLISAIRQPDATQSGLGSGRSLDCVGVKLASSRLPGVGLTWSAKRLAVRYSSSCTSASVKAVATSSSSTKAVSLSGSSSAPAAGASSSASPPGPPPPLLPATRTRRPRSRARRRTGAPVSTRSLWSSSSPKGSSTNFWSVWLPAHLTAMLPSTAVSPPSGMRMWMSSPVLSTPGPSAPCCCQYWDPSRLPARCCRMPLLGVLRSPSPREPRKVSSSERRASSMQMDSRAARNPANHSSPGAHAGSSSPSAARRSQLAAAGWLLMRAAMIL